MIDRYWDWGYFLCCLLFLVIGVLLGNLLPFYEDAKAVEEGEVFWIMVYVNEMPCVVIDMGDQITAACHWEKWRGD